MKLFPITEIGYVMRIKDVETNKIFNIFYDGRGDNVFKLNEEGKSCLITYKIDKDRLMENGWFHMRIRFDLVKDLIGLSINNQELTVKEIGLPEQCQPNIVFGKSDYIIDVPSVAIKNLSITNEKKKYSFALNHTHGNKVYATNGKEIGYVNNPKWGINNLYHWQHLASFKYQTVAGVGYNPTDKNIYYYNADSIYIYNINTRNASLRLFNERCPVNLMLGTNFIDEGNNKLYTYEVHNEENNVTSVAALNLSSLKWEAQTTNKLPQQLHHHGGFFNKKNQTYTIYGGFGNMNYSNKLYTYNIANREWSNNDSIKGNDFPRYFVSVGYDPNRECAYLFGGMGNSSGDQSVGRKYFYDLHKLDIKSNKITKLWEIDWKNTNNVVPVRGMIVADNKYFYTLCYSESISDSFLRLYRFNIKSGDYDILGDSIPIHSDKITTNANIYYDKSLHKLVATVQEFKDDIASKLEVYTLDFPPVTEQEYAQLSILPSNNTLAWVIVSVLVLAALCTAYIIKYRRDKFQQLLKNNSTKDLINEASLRPNSIYLFGDFHVRDRNNTNITYRFTHKLQQALIIMLRSTDNGISSAILGNMLWESKTPEKIKDSKGVMLSNLRKILKEMDGIQLVYNKGYFKLEYSNEFYCDFLNCIQITEKEMDKESKFELLSILKRGKFLQNNNQQMFDSNKDNFDNKIIPIILNLIEEAYSKKQYMLTTEIYEILYSFDPLNENGFIYLIKSLKKMKEFNDAHLRYHNYSLDYENSFGEKFHKSFNEI